jgi:hypothetical protein
LQDPISKNPTTKKSHHKKWAGGVTQGVGPEFKQQHLKKEKKKSQ